MRVLEIGRACQPNTETMSQTGGDDFVPKDSGKSVEAIHTGAQPSIWKKYQASRIAHPDLLALVAQRQKINNASTPVKLDDVVDNLKQRWKENLYSTAIGHQILIVLDRSDKNDKADKRLVAEDAQNEHDVDLNQFEILNAYFCLTEVERAMLVGDPTSNFVVQEHSQSHPFTFAARCYWHMLREKKDQLIFSKSAHELN